MSDLFGTSSTIQATEQSKLANAAARRGKYAAIGFQSLTAPVMSEYVNALKGIWNPETYKLLTSRLEDIGGQAITSVRDYVKALGSRGLTGGATLAGMRKVGEAEKAARVGAVRDIDIARYLQALQGIPNLAAQQMGMYAGVPIAPASYNVGGGISGLSELGKTFAQLYALKGGNTPTSMYSSPGMSWGNLGGDFSGWETGGYPVDEGYFGGMGG